MMMYFTFWKSVTLLLVFVFVGLNGFAQAEEMSAKNPTCFLSTPGLNFGEIESLNTEKTNFKIASSVIITCKGGISGENREVCLSSVPLSPLQNLPLSVRITIPDPYLSLMIPFDENGEGKNQFEVQGELFFPSESKGKLPTGSYNAQIGMDFSLSQTGCRMLKTDIPYAGASSAYIPIIFTSTPACSLSAQSINFGTQIDFSVPIQAQGGIFTTCTMGANYSISLDNGIHGGTSPTNLYMQSAGTTQVNYGLFSDATYTAPWQVTGQTGTGSAQTFTIYGQVAVQPNPPAGTYTDLVTATLTMN